MRQLGRHILASLFITAASFTVAAHAQTFPPPISWSSAPGAAVFDPGTAGVGTFLDVKQDLAVRSDFNGNSWWSTGYFAVSGQKISYVYSARRRVRY